MTPINGFIGRLAEGWQDYKYLQRRRVGLKRPWLTPTASADPLRWSKTTDGWRLDGSTLPDS